MTALKGAETLFYPTAIGWHPSEKAEYGERQYDAWQTIQRAHAIANGVFVCGVNRVGHERGDVIWDDADGHHDLKGPEGAGIEFWGGSFIADPFGRILAASLADQLAERGLEVAPRGRSTLVSWKVDDPDAEVARLADAGVVVRSILSHGLVRASVGAWSDAEELARVVDLAAA